MSFTQGGARQPLSLTSALFIDSVGRVGIGTTVLTSNLQITGNLYVSNIVTSNITGVLLSQWTGTTGTPIYYVPQVGIGSTVTPTANLQVTGNLYVSNAITTTNAFISNIVTSNITGVLLSQWTRTTA